jgi:signal transduction histidine kinase
MNIAYLIASHLAIVLLCYLWFALRSRKKTIKELQSVEMLRNDFIASVSHELKTPLSVIQNYSQLLQTPKLNETDRHEYAKTINTASQKLTDLITNILKLNKLENQEITPKKEKFNLSEQLRECVLIYESVIENKNITLDIDIADDIFVVGDSELLSIVWNNLLANAIKFTKDKITISLQDNIIMVADNGIGINKADGKHIFDKFYQADKTHSGSGNGLGLSLVKKVIDIVGASIYVESEPAKGSKFVVKLTKL